MKLSFLVLFGCLYAKFVYKTLKITMGKSNPDCLSRETLLVNGLFGGPELRFQKNDNLILTIHNAFNGSISIHLHGINQRNTCTSDGASGISNPPIPPGIKQTFFTKLDQAGTFLYHAHHEFYDLHVFGALVVEEDDFKVLGYDEDRVLVFSDYWRRDLETIKYGILDSPQFSWIGDADAFLVNGNTVASNCSTVQSFTDVTVEKGKRYRLRLVAATTLYIGYFGIPNHTMTLVEVEGELVEPINVEFVELMPGQRYSVIVEMNQKVDEYSMQFQARYRAGGPKNGISILKYVGSNSTTPRYMELPKQQTWIQNSLKPLVPKVIPDNPNPPIILLGEQKREGGKVRWTVNNISFHFPTTPLLTSLTANVSIPLDSKPLARFKRGEVVDFVFQNTVAVNGICEVHPWHIHGHGFYSISSGTGLYPNNTTKSGMILRDTIGVYGDQSSIVGQACGWTRVRFVADNPGVWAVHCHIITHYAMGMGGAFVVEEFGVNGSIVHKSWLAILVLSLVI